MPEDCTNTYTNKKKIHSGTPGAPQGIPKDCTNTSKNQQQIIGRHLPIVGKVNRISTIDFDLEIIL